MLDALLQLAVFGMKVFIIAAFMIIVLIVFFGLLARGKDKQKSRLVIKNLNEKYAEATEALLTETLTKKQFKQFLKDKKRREKADKATADSRNRVYVLNFHGDIKASAVTNLSEEVNAVLSIATPKDEVVLRLESAGGVVNGYGLAAAQLMRIRDAKIPLTITIDKVAASGGYMMAATGDKILAAPFSIIGSIGVVVQLPNFHRLLKDKHVDYELHTAGEFKRTITLFGQNTEEGREKLQEEIEDIHQQFKNMIKANRTQIDINQVATGEHWLGQQALELKLIDEIKTSDAYLQERAKEAGLFEIYYEIKKPLFGRLTAVALSLREGLARYWR